MPIYGPILMLTPLTSTTASPSVYTGAFLAAGTYKQAILELEFKF